MFIEGGTDVITNWNVINEVGTTKWLKKYRNDNAYVEFTTFSTPNALDISWLISPKIDMDTQEGEKLVFQTAQAFLRSSDNSLELMVSQNFDGLNVRNANWINIPFNVPIQSTPRFTFINSGIIDLSKFTGKINIAFKVKGSGTNSALGGTYQLDNINVYCDSKN